MLQPLFNKIVETPDVFLSNFEQIDLIYGTPKTKEKQDKDD